MAAPPGFEEFVTIRSARLLRAGYQLTHDWAQAEDLMQTAGQGLARLVPPVR